MRVQTRRALFSIVGSLGLGCVGALAGSATFNFNSDPSQILTIVGSGEWRPDGGASGAAGDGYLSVTDGVNSAITKIVFDDFDAGLVVKGFSFSCDFRVGNGTSDRPADGFSVNYCRAGDPALDTSNTSGWSGTLNEPGAPNGLGLPEEGTTTGIAIGFDAWTSGSLAWPPGLNDAAGDDVEGISVRVDNKIVTQVALPTRHGACDDNTSLQTGARDPATDGDPSILCWQPFTVVLDDAAKLTVTWKGRVLLDAYQTAFEPSAGRIVFAGRTGGANQNHHVDNIRITTIPSDKMVVGAARSLDFGAGFTIAIDSSGQSVPNKSTAILKLDGADITATKVEDTASGALWTYQLAIGTFAPGSTHTVDISCKDVLGATVSATRTWSANAYATVPAGYKLAGTPTGSGFKARVVQMPIQRGPGDNNSMANGEQQLQTNFGYENQADLTAAVGGVFSIDTINLNREPGTDVGAGESFNSTKPVGAEKPNDGLPGIPGTGALLGVAPENRSDATYECYSMEFIGFVQLTAGTAYRWGVNSDDGFRVSVGPSAADQLGVTLGQFSGGRGAADTLFDFVAEASGYYPVRLSHWQGDGGANVEFFSVDLATGNKVLLNDVAGGGLKVYSTGTGRAYVSSIDPYPGYDWTRVKPTVKVVLKDAGTTVAKASVKLTVDGADVTANTTVNQAGGTTTVTWTAAGDYAEHSSHTAVLEYQDGSNPVRTVNIPFRVGSYDVPDLSPNSFSIEAEDFDSGGAEQAAANTMPYVGGAYDGLGATLDSDYAASDTGPFNANGTPSSHQYRTGIPAEQNGPGRYVPMDSQLSRIQVGQERLDRWRPGAGDGYYVEANWKIGWAGGGEWYKYTRAVPAGVYEVYAALSHGDGRGTANRLRASLSIMEGGQPRSLGTFRAPSAGGWGRNGLVPMKYSDGTKAMVKITSTKTTLRFETDNGDFDWFSLSPVSGALPKVNALFGSVDQVRRDGLSWDIVDFSTAVNPTTVQVELDGADATAGFVTTKTAWGATVRTKAGSLPPRGDHTWKVMAKDTAGASIEASGTVRVNPYPTEGIFVIEAEDFNYADGTPLAGGKVQAAANTMPYLGNAYNNLAALVGVDYQRGNESASDEYRKGEGPAMNTPMNGNMGGRWGSDRGSYNVTTNYKIGWIGGGQWFNYTRDFPAATYEVWAALSFDSRNADDLRGGLATVAGDVSTADQTATDVGLFRAPGSGGWGANTLVPMGTSADASVVQTLPLSGANTVRFNADSGDFDYLVFVPVGPYQDVTKPKFTSIKLNTDGTITVEWEGGGTLEYALDLTGPWVPATGATSPYTFTPQTPRLFGRIKK